MAGFLKESQRMKWIYEVGAQERRMNVKLLPI